MNKDKHIWTGNMGRECWKKSNGTYYVTIDGKYFGTEKKTQKAWDAHVKYYNYLHDIKNINKLNNFDYFTLCLEIARFGKSFRDEYDFIKELSNYLYNKKNTEKHIENYKKVSNFIDTILPKKEVQ